MFNFQVAALITLAIGVWWALLAYIGIHLINLLNVTTKESK